MPGHKLRYYLLIPFAVFRLLQQQLGMQFYLYMHTRLRHSVFGLQGCTGESCELAFVCALFESFKLNAIAR